MSSFTKKWIEGSGFNGFSWRLRHKYIGSEARKFVCKSPVTLNVQKVRQPFLDCLTLFLFAEGVGDLAFIDLFKSDGRWFLAFCVIDERGLSVSQFTGAKSGEGHEGVLGVHLNTSF